MNITICRFFISNLEFNYAKELKRRGYEVNCISFYRVDDKYTDAFDNEYYVINEVFKNERGIGKTLIPKLIKDMSTYSNMSKLIKSIRKIKSTIFIGVGEPNIFPALIGLILNRKISKYIYLPYDITYYRYKDIKKNAVYDWFPEGYLYRRADLILHRGSPLELVELPYKYKDSVNLILNCNTKHEKTNTMKKSKISVVCVGLIETEGESFEKTKEVFETLMSQGMAIHVYPLNYEQLSSVLNLISSHKYLTIHPPIFGEEFIKEISKYDYGLMLDTTDDEIAHPDLNRFAISNRVGTYLEAGLPVIASKELEFVCSILSYRQCGVIMSQPKQICKQLKKVNYETLLKNVDDTRKKYSIEDNVDKLLVKLDGY